MDRAPFHFEIASFVSAFAHLRCAARSATYLREPSERGSRFAGPSGDFELGSARRQLLGLFKRYLIFFHEILLPDDAHRLTATAIRRTGSHVGRRGKQGEYAN